MEDNVVVRILGVAVADGARETDMVADDKRNGVALVDLLGLVCGGQVGTKGSSIMAHGGTGGREPTLGKVVDRVVRGTRSIFVPGCGGGERLNRLGELEKGDSKVNGNPRFKTLAFIPYRRRSNTERSAFALYQLSKPDATG